MDEQVNVKRYGQIPVLPGRMGHGLWLYGGLGRVRYAGHELPPGGRSRRNDPRHGDRPGCDAGDRLQRLLSDESLPARGRRLFLYQRGLRAGSRVSLLLVPLSFLPDHRFSQRDGAVPGDPNADGRRFQRSGNLHGQRKPGLSIGRYSYPYSLWWVLACCSSWQSRFCSGCIRSSP